MGNPVARTPSGEGRGQGTQEERIVEVARIGAPHGLRGAFWLHVSAATPGVLTCGERWHVRDGKGGDWREYRMLSASLRGERMLATLEGIDDRDAAEGVKGHMVGIARDSFPELPEGEYYWCDLVGLRVADEQGVPIGVVRRLRSLPGGELLEVDAGGKPVLVPFNEAYVVDVDVGSGLIRSRWRDDY